MTETYPGREHEPIARWFIPLDTPEGGAPEAIRQDWVGVPLPVRESNTGVPENELVGGNIFDPIGISAEVRQPTETVRVQCDDAFKALGLAGRDQAATWWRHWYEMRAPFAGSTLMFRSSEGVIMSAVEAAEDYPDTACFDDL